MSRAAISVMTFGIYLCGQALLLFFVPNFLLGLFQLPEAKDGWVRVTGIAVLALSYYYIRASLKEIKDFFRFTIHFRGLQLFLFIVLVSFNFFPPIILLSAGLEFLAGIWTWIALEQDEENEQGAK